MSERKKAILGITALLAAMLIAANIPEPVKSAPAVSDTNCLQCAKPNGRVSF